MSDAEVRISPELILSAYTYEKNGKRYQAGLDARTAKVNVVTSDDDLLPNDLATHFSRTTSVAKTDLIDLVVDATSMVGVDEPEKTAGHRAFVFLPTSRCNMGCSYCGQQHVKENVTPEVAERFLQRVEAAFAAPETRHVHVAWFGGEPLLVYRSILRMSERIVDMADRSGTEFSSKITTNGSLLTTTKMKHLIEDARVSRFDLTVDGPAAVHDQHRPLLLGGSSFGSIVETLSWFREAELDRPAIVVLRTNVDRHNADHVVEYLETMKRLGFDDPAKFFYDLSPIHSWSNDVSALELTTEDAARREIEWMRLMEELGLAFGLLPGRADDLTCVATDRWSEVIDSAGNMFSCTETPLTAKAAGDLLGNLNTMSPVKLRPRGQFDDWDSAVAAGNLPCSSCQLRPLCRGKCPKQWMEGTVPCPTIKLNFDDRLAMFMARHGYHRSMQ